MMTVAALSSVFRRAIVDGGAVDNGAEFLKEVGLVFGRSEEDALASTLSSSQARSSKDESSVVQRGLKRKAAGFQGVDPKKSAILIQAQIRRYLQQRKYRIQRLEHRLESIQLQQNRELARIERRKARKLKRIQRKHIEREEETALEYQKVVGIIRYLKRDIARCRRDLENQHCLCRKLKTDNQRMVVVNETTHRDIQTKKEEIQQLEESKNRLQTRLVVQNEAIRQCKLHREIVHVQHHLQVTPRHRHSDKAKSYETSIRVNAMNEAEEKCFHYRLVQDVYTLTPRSG